MINVAISITIFRIISSIIIIFPLSLYFFHRIKNNFYFILLLAGIFLTDFFDGYVARKFNQGTLAGKILDPIADKIAINACLLCLSFHQIIPLSIPFLLINRDILVMGVKMYAGETNKILETSFAAKLKTLLIMVLIILSYTSFSSLFPFFYRSIWYLLTLYSYYSMYAYTKVLF